MRRENVCALSSHDSNPQSTSKLTATQSSVTWGQRTTISDKGNEDNKDGGLCRAHLPGNVRLASCSCLLSR